MDHYEIYALKYAGPLTSSGAMLMWRKEWDQVVKRNYYIWCLQGKNGPIVVDTGVSPALAAKRKLGGYVNPAEVLARMNVRAEEVRTVILTHMHWDHASGALLFPKATFYVQEEEFRFWTRDPLANRPPFQSVFDESVRAYLSALEGTERLVLLRGDQTVLPGIECLLAPGHTFALQVAAVQTAKGEAIVGSDCGHTFRNYREDWPSVLIADLAAWMRTYDKLRSRVSSMDLLFPGHDILLHENYPEVAPDVTRLV